MSANGWTAADDAELDVLVYALVTDYWEHRERCEACQPCDELAAWREHKAGCRACQGDAPLTYGPPCETARTVARAQPPRLRPLPPLPTSAGRDSRSG